MALTWEQKQAVVAEVAQIAGSAFSVVAGEYRGLKVEEVTDLRKLARKQGVRVRIVKNTLARRALQGTEFECINERLVGPLILAFSVEDPGAAARVFEDFAKRNEKLVVKALSVSGQLLEASELGRLAKMPTRNQAISQLMAVIRAPLNKFAQTLNQVPGKLVRTLAAVKDQKQSAA